MVKLILVLSYPAQSTINNGATAESTSNGSKAKKRRKSRTDQQVEADSAFQDPDLDMATSPESSKVPKKQKKKPKQGAVQSEASGFAKNKKTKSKQGKAVPKGHVPARNPTPEPVQPVGGKCLRCREKGIKCNEAKPTCNQCLRGLWTCQYEAPGTRKRSRNGCLNCRSRKRKCTEEKPACAYCLKVDDDCMYSESV